MDGPTLIAGDPCYNPNLGRLQPWCPLRAPEEDEEWLSLVTGLIEKIADEDEEGEGDGPGEGSGLGPDPELSSVPDPALGPAVEVGAASRVR